MTRQDDGSKAIDGQKPIGEQQDDHPAGFPPCPGCGNVGHSIQVWAGEDETQLWNCDTDSCRVHEYEPRAHDPQEDSGSIGL